MALLKRLLSAILILLIVSVSLFVFPNSVSAAATDTNVQRYLHMTVGADETQRNITWYFGSSDEGKLQYAKRSGNSFPSKYNEVKTTTTVAGSTGFSSHQATMKELQPNTEYVYRLVNGATVSKNYYFKTGKADAFNFLFVGDPQLGASNVKTDTQRWGSTLQTMLKAFPKAHFLLSSGDQVNVYDNEEQYAAFIEQEKLYSLPVATVIGNHDYGSRAYSLHFNNPNTISTDGNIYGTVTAGSNYWYTYNDVLFLHLNSNSVKTSDHKTFMENAVKANPSVKWRIVVFHHSIFSAGTHAEDDDVIKRRNELVPIFNELDIDVVLMGHDHVYARTYMMIGLTPDRSNGVVSKVTDPEGILYITANSATGSKYYDMHKTKFSYSAVQSQEEAPTFANVEISSSTFKITTYRTKDMSVLDSFEIKKTSAGPTHKHTFVQVKGREANCITNGVVEHYKCTSCQKTYTDKNGRNEITEVTIKATGHIEGEPVIKQTSDDRPPIKVIKCTKCDQVISSKAVEEEQKPIQSPTQQEDNQNDLNKTDQNGVWILVVCIALGVVVLGAVAFIIIKTRKKK